MKARSVVLFSSLCLCLPITALSQPLSNYSLVGTVGSRGSGPGQFLCPSGITFDPSGNVYVAEQCLGRINRYNPTGTFLLSWGLATEAVLLPNPTGIAVGYDGYTYYGDGTGHIIKLDASGHSVLEFGTPGSSTGNIGYTTDIAVGHDGTIYVVDGPNAKVLQYSPDGTFVREWGNEYRYDGRLRQWSPGEFTFPQGIAIDGDGNIYVTNAYPDPNPSFPNDPQGFRVQKFSASGVFIRGWGGFGAGNGQFKTPQGLAVDGAGRLYVADWLNHRIQKFTGNGEYLTQWGSFGSGPGQFIHPRFLAVDPQCNVYVTDDQNVTCQVFRDLQNPGPCLSLPLPLPVARWGQCDHDWKTQSYDGNGASMCASGCAVTAAAMLMHFDRPDLLLPDGQPMNPGTLNSYLKSITGGYIGHTVDWWVIAGILYSNVPTWREGHTANTDAILQAEFAAGRPVLMKVGGGNGEHWVVATGQVVNDRGPTYKLQDPGFNGVRQFLNDPDQTFTREDGTGGTLASYNNDYSGIVAFRPVVPQLLAATGSVGFGAIVACAVNARLDVVDPLGRQSAAPDGASVAIPDVIDLSSRGLLNDELADPLVVVDSAQTVARIPSPVEGAYVLRIVGAPDAQIALSIYSYDDMGVLNQARQVAIQLPMSGSTTETFVYAAAPGGAFLPNLTASASSGGDISPAGALWLPFGGSQTFNLTPKACYVPDTLKVDGAPVPATSSITFTNVTVNHTIAATFVPNPAPVVALRGPASGAVFALGTPVNFAADFSDNSGDTHSASWTFDALPSVAGVVDEAAKRVSASYTFAASGVYMIRLAVSDQCGGSNTATQIGGSDAMIAVYDPTAGFVTGGGWLDSPPGAYAPDLTLVGRVNFAFVSKYQNGSSVPTGETEFQFKIGGLNFHSAIYEWLVISGARAQCEGSGTINGAGNYTFILTAVDGLVQGGDGSDKLRIKIIDRATSVVVYDTDRGMADSGNPLTTLGGGSIVIHPKAGVIPGSATPVPGPGGSANFSLSQNRPNPFGLDTEIQFSLREVSTVTIAIYDLAGREVAQLVNGEMEGGFYSTRWGGQNRAGELVQRGVYFLRMSARALRDGSRFTATRRMLVM